LTFRAFSAIFSLVFLFISHQHVEARMKFVTEKTFLQRRKKALANLMKLGFDVTGKKWLSKSRTSRKASFEWPTLASAIVDFQLLKSQLPLSMLFDESELLGVRQTFDDFYQRLEYIDDVGDVRHHDGEWFSVQISKPFDFRDMQALPPCVDLNDAPVPDARLVNLVEALMFIAEHGDETLPAIALPNVWVELTPNEKKPGYHPRWQVYLTRDQRPGKDGRRAWRLDMLMKNAPPKTQLVVLYTHD
jgi:hypothetical protein